MDRKIGIYVEGVDDAHFIDKLLEDMGVDKGSVRLVYSGGINEMDRDLRALVKARTYVTKVVKTIAIFRDCDKDPAKSLADANAALKKASLPVLNHSEIVEYDVDRRLGLFLIPSCEVEGALEDLLLATVTDDERFKILSNSLIEIEQKFGPLTRKSKRLAQLYLASRDPLLKGPGLGLKAGHFPIEHEALEPVKNFIKQLVS